MKTKNIFTIGSATFDIFVKPAEQAVMTFTEPESMESWMCLPYGGKVKIQDVVETFGGGATNTAVGFARMGFPVYCVSKIGEQYGEKVIQNLVREGVNTDFMRKTSRDQTGFSTILSAFDGDRTVLGYAGANSFFLPNDLPIRELKQADCIFLSHISGDSKGVLFAIEKFLHGNPSVRLAWNPGNEQIMEGAKRWAKLLKHTDILFLNKEEASMLAKTPYCLAGSKRREHCCHTHTPPSFLPPYADDVSEIMIKLMSYGVRNVVITDGRNGAQCSDRKHLYFCPVVTQKRVDTLGAGDAFATGFVSAVLLGKSLKAALLYGTLNASSVVSYYGAQKGLLTRKALEHKLKQIPLCVSRTTLRHIKN